MHITNEPVIKNQVIEKISTSATTGATSVANIIYGRTKQGPLPIVDISRLDHRNPRIQRIAAKEIGEIAEKNGFLYLSNHGVPKIQIDDVYEVSKRFFHQSLEKKNRYYIGKSSNHRGYVPVSEKGDYADEIGPRRYEAFDMGLDLPKNDIDFISGHPLLGPNVWPDIDGFKTCLSRYYSQMQRIGKCMCRAFEMALNVPTGYFTKHINRPVSQLRLIHYFQSTNRMPSGKDTNMGAHTDYECFTILHSYTPGLQILDLNNKWIDAPPVADTFYFNIGDMLEAWSNGRLVATPHRVLNSGEERYSIPYFFATDYDTVIEPLATQSNASSNKEVLTKKYTPMIAGRHLLNQLLRDFPYLKRRYEQKLSSLSCSGLQNPFESRIREVALLH